MKKINNLSTNNLSIGQKLIINSNEFESNNNIYYVKSGDTLYGISKKFGTTVNEIKKINNLSSDFLSTGQKLFLPSGNTYIVVSGDTLYGISKKFNTTVDKLKKDNNLSTNILSIGQKLIV